MGFYSNTASPASLDTELKSRYRRISGVVYGHRYYHPEEGRWLSRDPMGELGFVCRALQTAKGRDFMRILVASTEARHVLKTSIYYKQKHLSPSVFRFLNDPALSRFGVFNSYGFIDNTPLAEYDAFGDAISWRSFVRGLRSAGLFALVLTEACCIYDEIQHALTFDDGSAERSWWMHCYVACNVSRRCVGVIWGSVGVRLFGPIYEWYDPSGDREQDLEAFNYGGWTAAMAGLSTCAEACQSRYPYGPSPLPGR